MEKTQMMVDSNGDNQNNNYDRMKELKSFDETKIGVRGLVDSGIKKIPKIFIFPPTDDADINKNLDSYSESSKEFSIPIIDLGDIKKGDDRKRKMIIDQVISSCEKYGFFQIVNHGVPKNLMDEMLEKARMVHEQPAEARASLYTRNRDKKSSYVSNFDLFQAPATTWRDTYYCRMAPVPPKPEEIPVFIRETITEYSVQMEKLCLELLELISEGLGLKQNYLKDMEFAKGWDFLCHYYPECPQPELTFGIQKHTDADFLTILLPDNHISGLQVLHKNQWVDIPPVHGALIVNIGDLFQLITNDRLKSVEHRVICNLEKPRMSVACFFNGTHLEPSTRKYGPIKELLTETDRPKYRETTICEYLTAHYGKGLDGESALTALFKL
ncbi:1-aminocyclopropane-1-carboxylate oxidase homolog 2-like [Papaver somniferum]|uniref:1-aminocyclopropane-1-carboxylate oxidase homolog 2-like n=1 Tax=Papaver somniferum TaxID=3469 RepID=UPI000E6FEB5F|nr:1-aminocyclopropane-1-carboxylate oxidase homolog 2-like [Papaver somniferum]